MDHREPTFGGYPRIALAAPSESPPPGTIKGMIDRFRHAEPMSRADREKSREENGQSSEFWWRSSDPGSAPGAHLLSHPNQRRGSSDRFGPAAPIGTIKHGDTR